MAKPKFYQAKLKEIVNVMEYVYPHIPDITIAERMGNENACCPECCKNEWWLLPIESAAVVQGGKPYIECLNCGYQTHL